MILSLDGTALAPPAGADEDDTAPDRLLAVVADLEADQAVDVSYLRDGRTVTGTIVPRAMEGADLAWTMAPEAGRILRMFQEGEGPHVYTFRGEGDEPTVLRLEKEGVAPRVLMERLHEVPAVKVAPRIRVEGPQGGMAWSFRTGEGGCAGFGHTIITDDLGCVDGIQMIPLNEGLGEYFGASSGVLVTETADENPLGLRSGDVILEIGGRDIRDPAHAARILSSYDKDEAVEITVRRQNRETRLSGTRGG